MNIYLAGERAGISATQSDLGTAATRIDLDETAAGVWVRYIRRRLFSFYYHGLGTTRIVYGKRGLSIDIERALELNMNTFLDSGAFTAWSKNASIQVEDYAKYVRQFGPLFTVVSNLDDTSKNEKLSYDNQKALESLGCKVQPVFHAREDPRWLVKYLDEGYDYILIGGLVPESTQWLLEWLDDLWEKYLINPDGTPRVKIHGFGLTDQKLMFRYPWHSVDSTSWLMTGIFGACMFRGASGKLTKVVFSDESPQARKFKGWHYSQLAPPEQREVDSWLEPYGITAEQCGRHYSYRDVVNAAVFQNLEDMGATHFTRVQGGLF